MNKAYTTSLTQGLNNAGFNTDKDLQVTYNNYITEAKSKRPIPKGLFEQPVPIAEMKIDAEVLNQKANSADLAIITIGRNAGEGSDRKLENDFYLSDTEKNLIKNVSDAFHAKKKKVIVVLNIGGIIEVASWRAYPDAILLAWQPGMESGNAITDVITGKINPSGKLATTFPMDYNDVPSAKNFPGKEFPEQAVVGNSGRKQIPAEVTYQEGIYVGYRYYNTFSVKPAYEFGYGLSYTKFNYHDLKLSSAIFNNKNVITITVTNIGSVAGKEVVQLYISAPEKKMDKPAEELKAFAKSKLLQPGESQIISFIIKALDLASFDSKISSWVAEEGTYKIKIGASSLDIRQTAEFRLTNDLVVEKDSKVLTPQVKINELKND